MEIALLFILLAAAVVMLLIERLGAPVVLRLSFKGDVKREGRWLAQYGQGACAVVVALLIWRLDQRTLRNGTAAFVPMLVAVFGTAIVAFLVKRIAGRVRPGHPNAGRFLGLTLKHENSRESFPSSHTASAVAMSLILASLYPQAAVVFWVLAGICGSMRYLLDAHWPSDILAGFALGYGIAMLTWHLMGA